MYDRLRVLNAEVKLNLNKTQVMVYFSLYGEDFPIDEVTERVKVTPTRTYKKGDLNPNRSRNRYRKESS